LKLKGLRILVGVEQPKPDTVEFYCDDFDVDIRDEVFENDPESTDAVDRFLKEEGLL